METNQPSLIKISTPTLSPKPIHTTFFSKLPIFILILITLVSLGGQVYFYRQTQIAQKKISTLEYNLSQAQNSAIPDSSTEATNEDDLGEIGTQLLTYYDEKCSSEVTFPQVSEVNKQRYFWHVDASESRTYVMDGRTEKQKHPDQSVVIFTKPSGSKLPYYSSSVEIICGDNFENLSLRGYLDKTTTTQGWEGEIKYIIGGTRKFGSASLTEMTPESGVKVYRGIYKNKLVLISNSNAGGELQPIAKAIIDSISFR